MVPRSNNHLICIIINWPQLELLDPFRHAYRSNWLDSDWIYINSDTSIDSLFWTTYIGAISNKQLSYRREPALQGGLVIAKSGRLELEDNIYGHYRSIFNHCDVFGQQRNRNRRKNTK